MEEDEEDDEEEKKEIERRRGEKQAAREVKNEELFWTFRKKVATELLEGSYWLGKQSDSDMMITHCISEYLPKAGKGNTNTSGRKQVLRSSIEVHFSCGSPDFCPGLIFAWYESLHVFYLFCRYHLS